MGSKYNTFEIPYNERSIIQARHRSVQRTVVWNARKDSQKRNCWWNNLKICNLLF